MDVVIKTRHRKLELSGKRKQSTWVSLYPRYWRLNHRRAKKICIWTWPTLDTALHVTFQEATLPVYMDSSSRVDPARRVDPDGI